MQLYGLKTCDTCRKALKALPNAAFVDVRAEGVPPGVLRQAIEQFGEKIINTRSTTWRGLTEAQRAEPPEAQLAAHPTLMKRPLIVTEAGMYLGWGKDVQSALAG